MYLYHPNSGACSRPCLQLVFQNLLDLHTSHKTSKNITLFNHQLGVRCSMSMSWFCYSFTTTYLFGFVWKCWETPFHPSVNHHFPYSKYHNATGGIHPPFSEPDLSPFHQASSGKFRLSKEPRKVSMPRFLAKPLALKRGVHISHIFMCICNRWVRYG